MLQVSLLSRHHSYLVVNPGNIRRTTTTTTTPQIKNLIGRASENKRAARAARTYEQD